MSKKYSCHESLQVRYFERSGEFRPPKKGEHYLSGSIPEVYRAPNDLGIAFHIMREVPMPPTHVIVGGFEYRLMAMPRRMPTPDEQERALGGFNRA